ncbi:MULTISPECIES: ComF family protein [Bacillus cereus group]|uniref:ComF family protein n=1 Tax=Bacillus cereus group TaxID=86661 RepID=UPI00027BF53A|nr:MULTISPECIES: ComF family protein [Bacillus cereus group]ARC30715.1 amidophosphoribosyltransferase [Bacillus sp. FDAARGOS_235]EJV54304.1 comF family protein [Bacillus toyonensis]MED2693081.1 ComF family protein [Bacillus toyonensis]PEI64489.1 amidophosphoribosyltransferase [Bacillus toyonensis]PEP16808.1 amidophosphoribosyltransferase [Bacillus toyonensis]
MHCLLCEEDISYAISWCNFFVKAHKKYICDRCEQKISYIIGEICRECGRSLDPLPAEYKEGDICKDCVRWMNVESYRPLKNRSLYMYDNEMKGILAQFKFRGDAELVRIFHLPFRSLFQQYFANVSTVIAVPLSKEREYERGFNQAELLAACLPVGLSYPSLRRRETEKQSKKTRKERMLGSNPFYFQGEEMFHGQHILLVDDVYTTGITVRQIGSLLYDRGANEVSSLTLCRS